MSILSSLALGAVSGAGEAVQKASLEQQRSDLDVQKAKTIAADTASLMDQQRQDHATQFMGATTDLANTQKQGLLDRLSASSPDELSAEHKTQYDAITPYNSEIVKRAGLETGFIKPEDAVKNDLTAEKMQNLNQYWQGKIDNARNAEEAKTARAEMKADFANQSKTALAAGIGLVHADIQATTSQLNQLQRDKDAYLTNALPSKDPKAIEERKTRLADFDSKISDLNANLASNKIIGTTILGQLGIKTQDTQAPAAKPAANKAVDFNNLK